MNLEYISTSSRVNGSVIMFILACLRADIEKKQPFYNGKCDDFSVAVLSEGDYLCSYNFISV